MSRKGWLALVLVLCFAFPALAQKITVTGTVTDDLGDPLIGATVKVKDTSNGVATDFDGQYRLDVEPDAVLVFSFIGCVTQEIPVDGRTVIDVTLSENTQMLQEVVVVGYGVVKKSDATGSVAVIKPDDIEAGIATSTQDLLVGASPGVTVTTSGGDPTGNATIRIRGGSSLSANNNPLIVIDGVPQTDQSNAGGTNALTMVNPQNIESLTILKDASATAIYGSRASNGVIIITTKKGQSGRPQVNFAANWHVNTARNSLDLMGAEEFANVVRNDIGTDAAIAMLGNASTDWQKEVLRTTLSQDYNLSVGGSLGILPYRVSASYTDSQGILKTSSMQRTTVGINLNPKFFENHLSVNANVSGTYVHTRNADTGAIGAASGFNPTLPVKTAYNTTGDAGVTAFNGYTNITTGSGALETQASLNPLQMLDDVKNISKVYSSSGNIQLDYSVHFLPELHLNLNLGYQVSKNEQDSRTAANSASAWRNNDLMAMGSAGAETRYDWYELQRNTLLDFYANYRKDVDVLQSTFDIMVGYSWQKFDYHGRSNTYVNSLGYQTNGGYIPYDNGVYTISVDSSSSSNVGKSVNNAPMTYWSSPLQLVSFFGRFNYSFKDTYLLTFTLRDDATSRFSKDSRWGLFPSLALGWKISNMPFMEDLQQVWNEWKLRLGWGVTGQQDIGLDFPYMPTYTVSSSQGFQYVNVNGQWINPLYPNAYDPQIKWEETTTWNIGMDFAFLNNRITLAADWYLRNTKDLLAKAPIVTLNTSNYLTRNIGSLRNTGVEFTITARPIVNKEFTWTTSLNYSYNKNKITKLTGDAETSQIQAATAPSGTGTGLQYHMVGYPAFSFLVYQQVYDDNGDPVPGQYVDQNADGVINDADKIVYHSRDPKATFAWNNTLNYKNWDFGIVLRANFGNYVYNGPKYDRTRMSGVSGYQLSNLLKGEYIFPSWVDNSQLCVSDYFVENASFVRCDNISLGYTFSGLCKDQLNLRVFGVVQNPFVITRYKGLDPEVFSGIDNSTYPRPITVTLGLVATF
ncbi:MAG: TonB-dependent receptor [Bacteroidales bacterium]|nr:TonB-dependent receptor [Bacteroidales bacterium]